MRASWLAVYRALLLVAGVLGLFLVYQIVEHRGERGARPLLVLVGGSLVYVVVKLVVSFVRGTPTVFLVTRFNVLGASLASVGFLLLVVEYTGLEAPVSKRTAALLLAEPAVAWCLVLVDVEYLWVPVGRDSNTVSGYAWELTGVAVANQAYLTLLMVVAIALLVRFGLRANDAFNTQVGALVVAGSGPLAGNLAYYLGYVQVNPTPVAFVFSAFVVTWAVLRTEFLDLAPIGRGVVVDNIDAGVLIVDDDHRLIDVNERGSRLFGFDADEPLVGRHVDDVFANRPRLGEAYWSTTTLESGDGSEVEFDGRYYDVEVTELTGTDDAMLGRSLIVREVTGQHLRERELERKNERLERFTSVVTHDIRNPLEVIQASVEIGRENDEYEAQFDNIEENVARIEAIVEDLLTITREGDLEDTIQVDLSVVARRAWNHVETRDGSLETNCDRSVEGDPGRLVQLFENLFRNSVEHGGDDVTVRVGTVANEDGSLRGFFVEDDGAGVPEDRREKVFEDGYTTSGEGTGLGLSIVSEIADAHGWRIRLTDSESGGARFDIELGNGETDPADPRRSETSSGRPG